MPALLMYLLKLSVSLSAVYLFYRLLLRRLTFYNWNRWFLAGYTLLSFGIPFVDVSAWVDREEMARTGMVQVIPALDAYTAGAGLPPQTTAAGPQWNVWDWVLALVVAGMVLAFLRFLAQYLSYIRVRRQARLVSGGSIAVYQVDKNIVPFSFGSSIFLNQQLHSEAELKEIIRHEYVHVRQKHTLDILWSEVLCMVNWYNPFAWLLRRAIRQNLEFIADHQVLREGVDKKAYQYLLLKVIGVPEFRIASQFNFSSLKKRIVMMNKIKSARVHLVRFLFILPLLSVLLVAFRNGVATDRKEDGLVVAGIVAHGAAYEPLAGVQVKDEVSGRTAQTDERGYFSLEISISKLPVKTDIVFTKAGFGVVRSTTSVEGAIEYPVRMVEIVRMELVQNNGSVQGYSTMGHPVFGKQSDLSARPTYKEVYALFTEMQEDWKTEKRFLELSENSDKPYWVVGGRSFIRSGGGSWISTDEITDIIFVKGRRMTGAEVNAQISRRLVTGGAAMEKSEARKKYNINQAVLEIFTVAAGPDAVETTAPRGQQVTDTAYAVGVTEFYRRNPSVEKIAMRADTVLVHLKGGERELYPPGQEGKRNAEQKYGPLPPLQQGYPPITIKAVEPLTLFNSGGRLHVSGLLNIYNSKDSIHTNKVEFPSPDKLIIWNGKELRLNEKQSIRQGEVLEIIRYENEAATSKFGPRGAGGVMEVSKR